jgi:hypothetical protein
MAFVRIARFAAAFAVATCLAAQARNERTAAVGMRAVIEQVVLPGSELAPAPSDAKTPLAVRILQVWPHGELRRYDVEWTGLEAGAYDLGKFLVRKDGSSTADLPPLAVTVTTALGKGMVEPSEPPPKAVQRLDGYRTLQIAVGIAWGVGLLAILFVGRRFRRRRAPMKAAPTLADRLRPLVERVASGNADNAQKAELERLLLAFWRSRLDLRDASAADAIAKIRQHPEAGGLLRQTEAWLHMPSPPPTFDVQALLEPYRSVTAASFEPVTAKGTR